jgi:hypothetical protein
LADQRERSFQKVFLAKHIENSCSVIVHYGSYIPCNLQLLEDFLSMTSRIRIHWLLALAAFLLMRQNVFAVDIAWFEPKDAPNTSASLPTSTAYTSNLGVAFKTGSSGPFNMDWVKIVLTTGGSTTSSESFKLAIHDASNSTAYSAVAGTTALATDTVTYTKPTTTSTEFSLTLRASDIPNITNYAMASNTAYTLFIYNSSSSSIALRRTQGYADQTTNNFYNVSNGFTALDTFRNNTANYSNSPGSYPTLQISFGQTVVPEPSTWALGGISTILCFALCWRNRKKAACA